MKQRSVGFFGGSFDPIHFGHINLAIELSEACHLDTVIFCPAFCSPFRGAHPPEASPHHRLAMLRLALEGISGMDVCSYEAERQVPSYTIDTLKAIQKPGIQYHLMLSEESAAHFDQWKDVSGLLRIAPPLIGRRHGNHPKNSLLKEFKFISTRVMEISSTDIRSRLAAKRPCCHLMPSKVLDYIEAHRLYCLR